MWPRRDTMKHISHFNWGPLEGLGFRLRGLPRCTYVPSFGVDAELGNNPHPLFLPKPSGVLARGPVNSIHAVVYLSCWYFLDPGGELSLRVRHWCKDCRFSSHWRTVSHVRSHSPKMTRQNTRGQLAQYVSPAARLLHTIWYTFERVSPVWLSGLIIGFGLEDESEGVQDVRW